MHRLKTLLVLLTILAGCGPKVAEDAPRRVFFITVDTLRADHMSLYGYPRQTSPELARLAAGGVTFDGAIAQWPKTGASFASMFTGQYPQTTGLTQRAVMRVPEEYLTLPELFQENGYTTLGVVSNAVLAAQFGWNDGFDEFLETWGGGDFPEDPHAFRNLIHAPKVNELALPLLEKHAKDERLFVWLHYTDPHAPYMLPDGVSNPFLDDALFQGDTAVPPKVARGYKLGGRDDLKYYVAQYDANVLVADLYIGRILDRARELRLLEDSLIVFTADHGESLGEHGSWFEHGPLPYNTTAHVPLFFIRDGLTAGSRIGRPVELIDLYPTLRDLVVPGYEVPGLEGKSLAGFLRGQDGPDFRLAFSEAGEKPRYFRSVQDGAWKLVLGMGGRRPSGLELYDLASDPHETRNVATLHPEELRRLRRELMGWVRNRPGRHAGQEEDEETLKALRALGYAN
jgi:arylsulfatase A-like enzyme